MKRGLACFVALLLSFFTISNPIFASNDINNEAETASKASVTFNFDCASCVMCECTTGKILYASAEETPLPPASVTKVLTLLLVMEGLEDGRIKPDDTVTVSEYASKMGGSQVFLEAGEVMTVEELVKCTVIASANDAAVALAEHLYGSESVFVDKMNERASELGLTATHFENVTGLDDTVENHVTSALDVAKISEKLIGYDMIRKYAGLWQDSVRDGAFTLTNTNRLVRYYDGCTGLKTGSTDKAGYCVAVTAERDGLSLVAVVMGAKSRDSRNAAAKSLLDYGFSSYSLYTDEEKTVETCSVKRGEVAAVALKSETFRAVVPKGAVCQVEKTYSLPETLTAPFSETVPVGKVTYTLDGEVLGVGEVFPEATVRTVHFLPYFRDFLRQILFGSETARKNGE